MEKNKKVRSPLKKGVLNTIFVLLLLFPCAEIAARILGWKGQYNVDYKVVSSPDQWLLGDSLYGIRLNQGKFTVVLNDSLPFVTEHTESGTRRIQTSDSTSNAIYVMGCSFTYGYGVNNNQTFVQYIANRFQHHQITNFAVPGYGEVQAFLKLKTEISLGNVPKHVLVVYSKEHPQRNTMNRNYRSALQIGYNRSNKQVAKTMTNAQFPYFSAPSITALSKVKWEDIYKNWPGRENFACINALQTTIEGSEDEESSFAVTEFILLEIDELCAKNNIQMTIINLDDPGFEKHYPNVSTTIRTIPVQFDFSNHSLTNYPYDNHPNPAGHRKIAERILPTLEEIFNEK